MTVYCVYGDSYKLQCLKNITINCVLHFHVLVFHVRYFQSGNFMSCNFMSVIFSASIAACVGN